MAAKVTETEVKKNKGCQEKFGRIAEARGGRVFGSSQLLEEFITNSISGLFLESGVQLLFTY
jgi:hypothetical protein